MEKLVNLVSEKAGIGQDQARKAVETVIGFMKDRLPAPLASQLDNAVSGEGAGEQQQTSQGPSSLLS